MAKLHNKGGHPFPYHWTKKQGVSFSLSFMLAFQGLAALCEKEDNSKLKSELFEVYPKLLQFHKGCVLLLVCFKFNEYVHMNQ